MTSAALDRLLAVLMVSLAATGLVSLRAGHASDAWRLTPPEASRALLATGVAGVRLPVPNGAPCRLVVPDHRGLDWIKGSPKSRRSDPAIYGSIAASGGGPDRAGASDGPAHVQRRETLRQARRFRDRCGQAEWFRLA